MPIVKSAIQIKLDLIEMRLFSVSHPQHNTVFPLHSLLLVNRDPWTQDFYEFFSIIFVVVVLGCGA